MTRQTAKPEPIDANGKPWLSTNIGDDPPLGIPELARGNRRFAELVFRLVTEGQTPLKQAIAVGIGVFIGCIPVFGTHVLITLAVASITRLSRIRMYAATWVSNPIFAPFLVWSELQVGHFALSGRMMNHSVQQIRELGLAGLGWSLAIGTVVVGSILGFVAAITVWSWIPRGEDAMRRRRAIESAAHRYLGIGALAWSQVRNRLYGNPALAELMTSKHLGPCERIVDLGCGQGELLALLLEANATPSLISWVGVTSNPQWAARAHHALPSNGRIEVADATKCAFGSADLVFVWQARHRDAPRMDEEFIARIRKSVNPNGLLVITWSGKGLFDTRGFHFAHTIGRLENAGFSIEHRSESPSPYRRWKMIVARI